jgi:hypothetical protein
VYRAHLGCLINKTNSCYRLLYVVLYIGQVKEVVVAEGAKTVYVEETIVDLTRRVEQSC